MSSDLKVSVEVIVHSNRDKEVDVRVLLSNTAEIDYFIEARSFIGLDDRVRVSGASDIPCNLIQTLEPMGYSPTPLKIPSNGSLDSDYLHLSNACDFHNAVPGKYFVIYSTSASIYTDENLQFLRNNEEFELLAGSISFELTGA